MLVFCGCGVVGVVSGCVLRLCCVLWLCLVPLFCGCCFVGVVRWLCFVIVFCGCVLSLCLVFEFFGVVLWVWFCGCVGWV